jgi:hypothetical protein
MTLSQIEAAPTRSDVVPRLRPPEGRLAGSGPASTAAVT